jgi:uncharacterized protein with beta-barrel porin domain
LPAAGPGVTATCTGATIDQGPDANTGFGGAGLTDLAVTVTPGASVSGNSIGIQFFSGRAVNFGTVTGASGGVLLGSGSVENHGWVGAAAGPGIFANGSATVVNSGGIQGNTYGIAGLASLTLNNSGSVVATTTSGVASSGPTTVINSGSIQGGQDGVVGGASLTLGNSGSIVGTARWGAGSNGSATVVNSGSIRGDTFGVVGLASLTLSNSGSIQGRDYGAVGVTSLTLNNSGSIVAATGAGTNQSATVINSGSIQGELYGVFGTNSVTLSNSGTVIATGAIGHAINSVLISAVNSGTLIATGAGGIAIRGYTVDAVNSGTIIGSIGIASGVDLQATPGHVVNSGTVIGRSGTAIQFSSLGVSDSLAVLPGARFGGLVDFGGGADRVSFGRGSWILNTANFDAAASTVTTPGTPYFIEPNRIVVADLSGFGAMSRAMIDITGWIASVLPETPAFEPASGVGMSAFAAIDSAAPRIGGASASHPLAALPYAAQPSFTNGAVSYADGSRVWAKSFAGRRDQKTDSDVTGSTTIGYGGALGYEHRINPDLRLGGFVGASSNKISLDLNAGHADTDAAFGGLYARALFGASFVDFALIAGQLDNTSQRNISGGLAMETARASYKGWFVNPALTIGHRFALDGGLTLTPALKVRYVGARFDSYTETGSSANLTVGAQTLGTVEERAELTLAHVHTASPEQRASFRITGGVLGQHRAGDGSVDLALLGQNFIGALPGKADVFGLYAGSGIDWQIGGVGLFAAGDITRTNDSTTTLSARAGLRVAF